MCSTPASHRPRHGRAGRALARPQADRTSRTLPARQGARSTLRPSVEIEQGHRLCGRGCRHDVAALAACSKPRLAAEGLVSVYETAGAAAGAGAGRDGAARHLDRPADPVAGSPAISRRAPRRLEDEIYELAGERIQHRLAQAARRHPVRQAWACPAASKTKTGQWSTSAPGAGRPCGRQATNCRARSSTGAS